MNIEWARSHIRNFGEYFDLAAEKRADERRYREAPGYTPLHKKDKALRDAAHRGYDCHAKMLALSGVRALPWDAMPEQDKQCWEQIAETILQGVKP